MNSSPLSAITAASGASTVTLTSTTSDDSLFAKDIVEATFTDMQGKTFKCSFCKKNYKKGNGYSNLVSHVKNAHDKLWQTATLTYLAGKPEDPTLKTYYTAEARLSVVERAELRGKRTRISGNYQHVYGTLACVTPNSNDVERLFSRTKLIYRDRRQRMKMDTLEMVTLLRYNRDLWEVEMLLDEESAVEEESFEEAEREEEEDEDYTYDSDDVPDLETDDSDSSDESDSSDNE
eukprot:gene17218-19630_t